MAIRTDALNDLRLHRSPETGRRARRRLGVVIALVISVLIAIVAVTTRIASRGAAVTVVRAEPENPPDHGTILSASGYIVPHHRIDVNSKVTGRVAWIGVEKGDNVSKGQVLVRLEDDEFRAQVQQAEGELVSEKATMLQTKNGLRSQEINRAQQDLEQARAVAENDQKTLARAKALFDANIASRQQLEEAEAQASSSSHHVRSLEETYTLAKLGSRREEIERARGTELAAEGRLAFARAQLAATVIKAPTAGTILERTAERGELITAEFASGLDTGGPRGSVVVLADLNDLQVDADIGQEELAVIQSKPNCVIYTDAYPDRKYQGVIREVSPEGDRQKGTVNVRIKIRQPDAFLRPEMNATVDFVGSAGAPAGVVRQRSFLPARALVSREGRDVAFVVEDGRVKQRTVNLKKKRADGWILDGVDAGEEAVMNPDPNLENGNAVHVVNGPATKTHH